MYNDVKEIEEYLINKSMKNYKKTLTTEKKKEISSAIDTWFLTSNATTLIN